jgi:polysaccharide biosynthesis protein PslH
MSRPSLLFAVPIVPAAGGNGLAMRAGVFLDALARDFDVTLLVLPVVGGADAGNTPFVARRARCTIVMPLADKLDPLWDLSSRVLDSAARTRALVAYPRPALCRFATSPCLRAVTDAIAGEQFDWLHVMRMYLAPYVWPLLTASARPIPVTSLDLDDEEPSTHRRLAELHHQAGRLDEEQIELAEARKYEALARDVLPRFHKVIGAASVPGQRIAVVPNTVALPKLKRRATRSTRRLLFVGNLAYLPNAEGIRSFVTLVLPQLRGTLGNRVVMRIAGSAPPADVLTLANAPGVEIVPNPLDLAPHYAWADVAIAPLFAGGGTRIKLLEAFAHCVPVVSTTIGAEGIAVTHGEHLLLADTSAALFEACAALLTDRPRAAVMAKRAWHFVAKFYSHARGEAAVREALSHPVATSKKAAEGVADKGTDASGGAPRLTRNGDAAKRRARGAR